MHANGAFVALLALSGAVGWTGAMTAGPATQSRPSADARCSSCHQVEHALSHPTGFAPGRPLPAEYPLEAGLFTCLTCHTDHAARPHTRAGGLLRSGIAGTQRCADCHDRRSHALAIDAAHLAWPGTAPAKDREVETRSCLECHDGSVAGDAASHRAAVGYRPGADHPVGITYRARPSRNVDEPPLHPPAALDSRIRLFGGAVGCGSCHSLYSTAPGRLVMDNHASALCLSCHAY